MEEALLLPGRVTHGPVDDQPLRQVDAEEIKFIPLDIAKQQVREALQFAQRQKQRHLDVIERIEGQYAALQAQTKTNFDQYVAKLVDDHKAKLRVQQTLLEALKEKNLETRLALQDRIQAGEDALVEMTKRHAERVSQYEDELARIKAQLCGERDVALRAADERSRLEIAEARRELGRCEQRFAFQQNRLREAVEETVKTLLETIVQRVDLDTTRTEFRGFEYERYRLLNEIAALRDGRAPVVLPPSSPDETIREMSRLQAYTTEQARVIEGLRIDIALLRQQANASQRVSPSPAPAAVQSAEPTASNSFQVANRIAMISSEIEVLSTRRHDLKQTLKEWEAKFVSKKGRKPKRSEVLNSNVGPDALELDALKVKLEDLETSLAEAQSQPAAAPSEPAAFAASTPAERATALATVAPAPSVVFVDKPSELDRSTIAQLQQDLDAARKRVKDLEATREKIVEIREVMVPTPTPTATPPGATSAPNPTQSLSPENPALQTRIAELESSIAQLSRNAERDAAEAKKVEQGLRAELEMNRSALAKAHAMQTSLSGTSDQVKALQEALSREMQAKASAVAEWEAKAADLQKSLQAAGEREEALHKVMDEQIRALQTKSGESEKKIMDDMRKAMQKESEQQATKGKEAIKAMEKRVEEAKAAADAKAAELETVIASKTAEIERLMKEMGDAERAQKELQSSGAATIEKLQQEMEALKADASERVKKAEAIETDCLRRVVEAEEGFRKESILRKKLQFEIEDMKGAIRVYCRSRPLSSSERERGDRECVRFPDQFTALLESESRSTRGGKVEKRYEFDQVFSPATNGSQDGIFAETRGLVNFAIDGYNVCIFAYGQTGSGKTFTMAGTKDAPGLKPRFVNEIFDIIRRTSKQYEYSVRAYMLEIYLDELQDLFWKAETKDWKKLQAQNQAPTLKVQKNAKNIVVITGAVEREFTSADALLDFVTVAESNRVVGSTAMNAESSRSHLIFGIFIERTDKVNGKKFFGKLSLVDLAGSESVKKTGATKQRLKEAMSINKSLSCLGNVINKLSKCEKFIPYRDNILTKVMEDSLGNNAKTLMFVNISPSEYNYDESVGSLTYASLVKTIVNSASVEVETKEMARLKAEIKSLKAKLGEQAVEEKEDDAPPPDAEPPPASTDADNEAAQAALDAAETGDDAQEAPPV